MTAAADDAIADEAATSRSRAMPDTDPGVRLAVPSDAGGITALCAAALPVLGYRPPAGAAIAAAITAPQDIVAVAERDGRLAACIAVSTLAWDSVLLEQRIARVSFLASQVPDEAVAARLIAFALEPAGAGARWDSVWMRIAAGDVAFARAASRSGGEFMGVLVTFIRSIDPGSAREAPLHGFIVRPAIESDVPRLRDIASGAFRTDRYHHDASVTPARVDAMWAQSVENSVRGRADAVLVADPGEGPAGFITLHRNAAFDGTPRDRTGVIGLIAVARGMEGRGIGRELIAAAVDWGRGAGLAEMEVGTQGDNQGAMRLYGTTGFIARSIHLDFRIRATA